MCNIVNNIKILYVILNYSNFSNSKRRKELFYEFLERMKILIGIRIVIVEATATKFDLPIHIKGVFMHLRYKVKHYFWSKENFLNVAISKLPSEWEFVSWIDTDISFTNKNWVNDTINELKKSDVVQLFKDYQFLDEQDKPFFIGFSLGSMHHFKEQEWNYLFNHGYDFRHPGYAWAITRYAYDQVGGLFDEDILGSGDSLNSIPFIHKIEALFKK